MSRTNSFSENNNFSYVYTLTIAANIGSIYTGFLFVAFNACEIEAENGLGLSIQSEFYSTNLAIFASTIPFGALFGAILSGYFGYKIGRRNVIIFADIICLIGALITTSNQKVIFLVGRIITGISCGMNYNIVPLFVREMSPPEISGKTGGFFKLFWSFGIFIAFLEALALPTGPEVGNLWKYIMVTPIFFALSRILCFWFYITDDTPKFYLINKQDILAESVLGRVYGHENAAAVFLLEKKSERAQGYKDIFGNKYKNQLILCLFLYMIMQFTGINAVNFYSTMIFFNGDYTSMGEWEGRLFNLGYGIIRIIGAIFGCLFIDKIGRKSMIIVGWFLTAIVLFFYVGAGLESLNDLKRCILLVYSAIQSMTITSILPIYASELLPSNGIGLIVIFDCICIMIVTFTFPYLAYESIFNIDDIFGLYGCIAFISVPILIFTLKETKNKSLHEIYKMFHSGKNSGLLDEDAMDDFNEGTSIQNLTLY